MKQEPSKSVWFIVLVMSSNSEIIFTWHVFVIIKSTKYYLKLSLPVIDYVGDAGEDTELPSNSNILKTVRVNAEFDKLSNDVLQFDKRSIFQDVLNQDDSVSIHICDWYSLPFFNCRIHESLILMTLILFANFFFELTHFWLTFLLYTH